jgi:hypothetical protein
LSPQQKFKKIGLGDVKGQKKPCHHQGPFFFLFPTGKYFGLPKRILEKKIEKCKKGDEITRFDGTVPNFTIRAINKQYLNFQLKKKFTLTKQRRLSEAFLPTFFHL